ncbi:MAG: tetratricopeptide repeat protein, partial [Gemmatimonadales bacterium]
IMGFPVAVVVAWAFELAPEGVRRTPSACEEREAFPDGRSGLPAKTLVALGLLVAAIAVGWFVMGNGGGEPEVTDRSIAVLPFETLGQEETTTFTDGVHGDLLTRLSHISDLSVISRTSVMRYRTSEKLLPAIAAELGVAWVLHGEVQETGDQVQVNARLVNAGTDRQVWAESYRRKLTAGNLFEIQAEITRQIARALETRLSPEEERQVERTPTENLDAYRLYAQGRELLDQRTEDGMRRALDYFQRAIAQDSSYALAWVGLADGLSLLEFYNYPNPGIALGARQAARRALELDPTLGEAHASLGIVHSVRQEGPEAVLELQRAVELRPGYAEAHAWLGWMHVILGRQEEALEPMKRAAMLDPLAPAFRAYLAEAYLANGRSRDALREARRAREIQPDYPLAHFMEGLVLYQLGMMAEAKAVLRDVLPFVRPRGTPSLSEVRAVLAVTHAASGDSTAARELLARIEEANHPFSAGLVHAALGEDEAAFDAFARVSTWDSFSTEHFRYFFPDILGPLRDDPRYQELLREVDRSWGL